MKKLFSVFILLSFILVFNFCEDDSTSPQNTEPVVEKIVLEPEDASFGDTVNVSCAAKDEDGDQLTYTWSAKKGSFPNGNKGNSVLWLAPDMPANPPEITKDTISVTVNDGENSISEDTDIIIYEGFGSSIGTVFRENSNEVIEDAEISVGDNSTKSGSNGKYELNRIPVGTQTVTATKFDYEDYEAEVSISKSQATEHDIHMEGPIESPDVTGYVVDKFTDEPIAGVSVSISEKSFLTDEEGYFQLANITDDTVTVAAEAEKYKPFSERIILPGKDKTVTLALTDYCEGLKTVDYEGETYKTVIINERCWFKENLNVGNESGGSGQSDNDVIEKYCYDNNPSNCEKYGGLYTWNEAMQYSAKEQAQGICPDGWHVPTASEYSNLTSSVNGNSNALKTEGVGEGDGAGTNESGFSALLGGYRNNSGDFEGLGEYGDFWTSTGTDSDYSSGLSLYGKNAQINIYTHMDKGSAFSVRCIKVQDE